LHAVSIVITGSTSITAYLGFTAARKAGEVAVSLPCAPLSGRRPGDYNPVPAFPVPIGLCVSGEQERIAAENHFDNNRVVVHILIGGAVWRQHVHCAFPRLKTIPGVG